MTTTEQNITILKHLANDREPGWVAAAVGVTVEHVEQVADEHGWPDPDKVRWAIDELTAGLGRIPTKSGPTGIIHNQRPAAAPTKPAAAPQQPATPARPGADPIADLLQRAKGSDKARTRNLADKIHGLVADLRARLDDEHAARQAAEKEAREKAARDAEIAKLEQRLAELKGKPTTRHKTPQVATDGPSAKDIRAWATEHDIDVPPVGRIPKAVREQYDAHHRGDAA